jgi:hypothetical protein
MLIGPKTKESPGAAATGASTLIFATSKEGLSFDRLQSVNRVEFRRTGYLQRDIVVAHEQRCIYELMFGEVGDRCGKVDLFLRQVQYGKGDRHHLRLAVHFAGMRAWHKSPANGSGPECSLHPSLQPRRGQTLFRARQMRARRPAELALMRWRDPGR